LPQPGSPTGHCEPGSAGALITLVNGALAGVGSVYVGTHPVLITVIAAAMAVALAVLVLAFHM
jgi:hypothetical protein